MLDFTFKLHPTLWFLMLALFLGNFACTHTTQNSDEPKQKSAVTTTESGLQYSILRPGQGTPATSGHQVLIHEMMTYLHSDEALVSTYTNGQAAAFTLGANQVTKGMEEGVTGMQKGEIRELIIPPHLSQRTIYPDFLSPDSTLRIKVELVDIVGTQQAKALSVMYRSVDNGQSWSAFASGLPNDATISGFTTLNNQIFAITDYHGIFSLETNSDHWKACRTGLPPMVDINAIVATEEALVIGTFRQGFFRSIDGGQNWETPQTNLSGTAIRDLIETNGKLLAGTDFGIYASEDQGITWQHVYGDRQINSFTKMQDKVYAGIVDGVIMSTDRGSSWQYIFEPYTIHNISNNGEYLYAMPLGTGLMRSKDDGQSWEPAHQGLAPLNLYTFEVQHIGPTLFAAQHDGIFQSFDQGHSWTMLRNGLPMATPFSTMAATDQGLFAGIAMRK